jgi:hypothetical protein
MGRKNAESNSTFFQIDRFLKKVKKGSNEFLIIPVVINKYDLN